jgi:hypothetical protein
MLASSTYPAAMRRYTLAGFELLPMLMTPGTVRRESLPAGLRVRLLVAERGTGRGYALLWEGSPAIVAATGPEVTTDLLWPCLAEGNGKAVEVRWITGAQNWAVPVVLDAGLSLSPAGPICVRGKLGSLTPYLPSGPFL